MINVTNKTECCGCQACAERCPKSCISFREDAEGFLYPQVETTLCINCHLCEKVCPIINHGIERDPISVYAAINNNEDIRFKSSSGGVFSLLAETIIKQSGVVFGAKWNSGWGVEHDYTDTLEGIKAFRGSKYVQSDINGSYSRVESFLKQGRKVLFTGTPCQIAGLKNFLKREYDNLILVDCICHGIPSPGVFRQYLNELLDIAQVKANNRRVDLNLVGIDFRDKKYGWNNYHCTFTFETTANENKCCLDKKNKIIGNKRFTKWRRIAKESFTSEGGTIQISTPNMLNVYFRGFNSDLFSRPSCSVCKFRGLKSGSDITLGDFWGIQEVMPQIDDNKGVSSMLINSPKGLNLFESLNLSANQSSYEVIRKYNHSVVKSDRPHRRRSDFFAHDDLSVHQRVYMYCWPSSIRRMFSRCKAFITSYLHFQ